MNRIYTVPFGNDFIEVLKNHLLSKGEEISQYAVIFAGKRPSLYLRRALADHFKRPFYPPQSFSITEFIADISRSIFPGRADLDDADAIWRLYEAVQTVDAFQGHSFREKGFGDFYYWGRHILAFINQLDSEDIPDERLHSLEKNAEIGYDVPASINGLLEKISLLRRRFHGILDERKAFTRGYKQLKVRERIGDFVPGPRKFCFAGLFGLTGTEKAVVNHFFRHFDAEFIIEGDPKEWPILAELVRGMGGETEEMPGLPGKKEGPPVIRVHSGFDTHSEVLKVYEILEKEPRQKTAVVLPMPDPLFPLLTFAVDRIDTRYNISLGYPLTRTAVSDLISNLLKAQMARRQGGLYPAVDYLTVLLHPFIKNLKGETGLRLLLTAIERSVTGEVTRSTLSGKPFLNLRAVEAEARKICGPGSGDAGNEDALKALAEIHGIFFENLESAATLGELARALGNALQFVLGETPVRSFILSGEIFKALFEILERTENLAFSDESFHEKGEENRRVIADVLLQRMRAASLPFDTRPVEPLEIIGMLESRNISFETVILLDANEGVLPEPKRIDPLIPLGVYSMLGIPRPEQIEEIYRYYFYRLIGSARSVHLLYVDAPDRPRSRYVEQVIWKEEKRQGALDVLKVDRAGSRINLQAKAGKPSIEKTGQIVNTLLAKIYSPSVMDDYIRCPVAFYYRHVLGFSEKRRITAEIDPMEQGTIIHRVLQDTFAALHGSIVDAASYDRAVTALRDAMEKHFDGMITTGDYYLFKELAAYKLAAFLKAHIKENPRPFTVEAMEKRVEGLLRLENGLEVRLKGRIDRIDSYPEGDYRILDYKTGGTRKYRPGLLGRIGSGGPADVRRYVETLQLPLYVYLFQCERALPLDKVEATLILLKSNGEERLFDRKGMTRQEIQEGYMKAVDILFTELLDTGIPFIPFREDLCEDCEFGVLCHL